MVLNLPPLPPNLKSIQHYLKTASEHEARDPVVAYWCRLFALQTGLKLDKKSDEARLVLITLMNWLETEKKNLSDNEAITNDIVAQAHIENYALKLFTWADAQDRASVFNKNVVKAFYTAGMLLDVLTTFGELSEELASNCKYAKWKAAYIHNCLKSGETPVPGPLESDEDLNPMPGPDSDLQSFDPIPRAPMNEPTKPVESQQNLPSEANIFVAAHPSSPSSSGPATSAGVSLDPTHIAKAQKYCKFAGSALNYDDVPEAINYLSRALRLLQTGEDSPVK